MEGFGEQEVPSLKSVDSLEFMGMGQKGRVGLEKRLTLFSTIYTKGHCIFLLFFFKFLSGIDGRGKR